MKVCLNGGCYLVRGLLSEILNSHPATVGHSREMNKRGGRERKSLWHHKCRGHHGSQLLRSALSKERLLVFRGDMGLGGLLRLELLEAVECLGESESSTS